MTTRRLIRLTLNALVLGTAVLGTVLIGWTAAANAQVSFDMDTYDQLAAELDAAYTALDAATTDAERDEAVSEAIRAAVEFSDWLDEVLVWRTAPEDVQEALRADRGVLVVNTINLMRDAGRCDDAAALLLNVAGSELYGRASESVAVCRQETWGDEYESLAAEVEEVRTADRPLLHAIALESLALHMEAGIAVGVDLTAHGASTDEADALRAEAVDELARAALCDEASRVASVIRDLDMAARSDEAVATCRSLEWTREYETLVRAVNGLRASAVGSQDDGVGGTAELELVARAKSLARHVRAGISTRSIPDALQDEARQNGSRALRDVVVAHVRLGQCEAARDELAELERASWRVPVESSIVWPDAAEAYRDLCGRVRETPVAGITLLTIGGTALVAGLSWDLASALGPRAELDEIQASCSTDPTSASCDSRRGESLEDQIERSRAPIAVLSIGGGVVAATGLVLTLLHGRRAEGRSIGTFDAAIHPQGGGVASWTVRF